MKTNVKNELIDELRSAFEQGYGVHEANNSCGYSGVIMSDNGGEGLIEEIKNDATGVRRIDWDDEEFLPDFVGSAERYNEDGEECKVWAVDYPNNFRQQIITYGI
jgi:hypothetical protein